MKRSNNRIQRDVAFLYERLSRDDDLEGESYSIANQKKLLIKAANEKGYTHLVHFYDDGISGVTMDRPEFNQMIEQLKIGKAGAIFVKDLSLFQRSFPFLNRRSRFKREKVLLLVMRLRCRLHAVEQEELFSEISEF